MNVKLRCATLILTSSPLKEEDGVSRPVVDTLDVFGRGVFRGNDEGEDKCICRVLTKKPDSDSEARVPEALRKKGEASSCPLLAPFVLEPGVDAR